MNKRFTFFTVVSASLITAVAVAMLVAWTGNVRRSSGNVAPHTAEEPAGQGAMLEANPYSFADLAEKVQSAVVNISTSKKIGRQKMMPFPRFGPQDPFDDFFDKFFEGMPRERDETQRSLGSGFIIDKEGTILTNNHVVSQADEIEVQLSNGKKYKAKVVGQDEKSDIAVIRIKADKDLPFAPLGSSKVMRAGDWVMAIGNPFGLEHTVTVGVISAMGRAISGSSNYARFIQTDASINPGNSGGPLFNLKGEVIGINTMIYAGGQGIGFAIPIDMAKAMLPDLMEKGSVTHGFLGVTIQDITPELAKSFGLADEQGALIANVFTGSPAAKAGLKRGDVIVKFNGQELKERVDLQAFVNETKPGSKVSLDVMRDGKIIQIEVEIGKQEGAKYSGVLPGEEKEKSTGKADVLGLVVKTITPQDASELDIPSDFSGVVVTRVEPDSAAEGAGIRSGDVILEINSVKIGSLEAYSSAVKELAKGKVVRLFVKRGKDSIYLAFGL